MATKARERGGETLFPQLTAAIGGGRRLLMDQPLVLFHVIEKRFAAKVSKAWGKEDL